MKTLIGGACLCVIGWTVYYAGEGLHEYGEHKRYMAHVEKAWTACMIDENYDIAGSLNNSYENRAERCVAKGYVIPTTAERIYAQRK